MDDEVEAVQFVNEHIKNTTAFTMEIGDEEVEQDCTAVRGTNGFHEYWYE